MVAPLKVGLAGLGTVGTSVVRLIAEGSTGRALRTTGRGRRGHGPQQGQGSRHRSVRSCAGSTIRSRLQPTLSIDVFVELMGGDGDPAKAAIEAALSAGKSVVTANKALLAQARTCACAARGGERRRAQFRGRRWRRNPCHQDVARRLCRQFLRAHLRHSERHLQLHPDPHGAGEAVLRRMPEGCTAAGLCRGRSDLRRRRLRYRAETCDPRVDRVRHQGRFRCDLCRGHFLDRAGRSAGGRRTGLSHQAAWRCGEDREPGSSSASIRPWCRRNPRSHRSWASPTRSRSMPKALRRSRWSGLAPAGWRPPRRWWPISATLRAAHGLRRSGAR